MSGYNSRFLYDTCTFDQNLKMSTDPCRYDMFIGKFENDNMTIKNGPCKGDLQKYGCKHCTTNEKATLEAKWSTIGVRTDLESDLWCIDRPNTRCAELKYFPRGPKCNKVFCNKVNPKLMVVNTLVCDRHIVPSQNKMPKTNGFD